SPDGAAGLRRWGLIEIVRTILLALFLGVALSSHGESSALASGLLLPLAWAVLTAIGLRGLMRFSAAAFAAGVRATAALALPIVSLVLAASMIPSFLEALVTRRDSALTRVVVLSVEVVLLTYLSLTSAVGAVVRTAEAMNLFGIRRFARLLRAVLVGVLVSG